MSSSGPEVWQAFVRFADTLTDDFEITRFLDTLTSRAVDLLGVSACRVLLADRGGRLDMAAASTDQARLPALFWLRAAEGPCVDAYRTRLPVSCPDLRAARRRWPAVASAALAAGFGAVHAMPMMLREHAIGALSLYSTDPSGISAETAGLGQALAEMATIGILHERALRDSEAVAEQLQNALHSRVVIEQAKGILAERLGLAPDDAFDLLRAHARDHRVKLDDTARAVVDGDRRIAAPGPAPETGSPASQDRADLGPGALCTSPHQASPDRDERSLQVRPGRSERFRTARTGRLPGRERCADSDAHQRQNRARGRRCRPVPVDGWRPGILGRPWPPPAWAFAGLTAACRSDQEGTTLTPDRGWTTGRS